ncbi:MAG: methyltransferase domain-containing protein [Lachnospiraceae bacterium]|nr:methyltransferase domain-containing protein [Lachnospiraceae bacterium]
MTEKVGKVTLDLTYYPGEDFYSDGTIEDELLAIAKEHKPDEFPEIIEKKKNWPVFYHLSPFRTNIIDWLPIKKTDKVLEIGSGCGAITGTLADKAGSVTCIDLSKKRSLVNAYRNQDKDNITIMVGNFKDIEPNLPCDYDYVFLIGVFEYGQAYIGGRTPYEDFMKICNRHRNETGRLVIAIENKFGLKYWAGCREDHLGTYFAGLEGYPNGGVVRTFTKKGLEKIVKSAGISQYSFYYPYPDYKFPTVVYSDRYLPKQGELSNNLRNFDRDRMVLFDEKLVFDQIVEEEEFPLFSNSYLLIVGKPLEEIYCKFSNDRANPWAIKTAIYENTFNELYVEKIPVTKEAVGHMANTAKAYELLSKRYAGTKVRMNQCSKKGNRLVFPFCEGVTLEKLLDWKLENADVEGFKTLIDEYMKWLTYGEEHKVSNIDFIFGNIIIKDDIWNVIDYEWTYERFVSAKEIAFRAFYNYMLGSPSRKACEELLYQDILGLTEEEIAEYIGEEREFQKFITGKRAAVGDMRELIGCPAYSLEEIEMYMTKGDLKYSVQLFWDFGEGFKGENSIILNESAQSGASMNHVVLLPESIKQVRIDPCSFACAVKIKAIRVDDKVYTRNEIFANGDWIDESSVIFGTEDPNIIISCEGGRELGFEMEIIEMPEEMACQMIRNNQEKDEQLNQAIKKANGSRWRKLLP